jgi:hypothetical protein
MQLSRAGFEPRHAGGIYRGLYANQALVLSEPWAMPAPRSGSNPARVNVLGWRNSGRAAIFAPPNSAATTRDGWFGAQFWLSNEVKPTAPATASRLTS